MYDYKDKFNTNSCTKYMHINNTQNDVTMNYLQSAHIVAIFNMSENLEIPVCFTGNTNCMGQPRNVSTREHMELDLDASQGKKKNYVDILLFSMMTSQHDLSCNNSLLIHYSKMKQNKDTNITPIKPSKSNFLKTGINGPPTDVYSNYDDTETFFLTQ